MSTQLTPSSITTVKAIVNFSRLFSADVVKLTSSTAAAIDDIPSLFIMFDGISYAGPDVVMTRIRDLSQRLALVDATISVITGGVEDKPKSLQIKSGRSVVDFRLANDRANDRLPSKFSGVFLHELDIPRADLTAAIVGAASIGAKLLTFTSDSSTLILTAASECETHTTTIDDVPTTSKFQYNYGLEHLSALDKMIPKAVKSINFSVTAKGHMRIVLPTEVSQITASVFLIDVKNR